MLVVYSSVLRWVVHASNANITRPLGINYNIKLLGYAISFATSLADVARCMGLVR